MTACKQSSCIASNIFRWKAAGLSPAQVLIYKALGWKQPQFSHVSLILAPDKSKLSKRHGATSLGEFRHQGFLPQAMLNYLTLLGWNDGSEQEVFTLHDLQVICSPPASLVSFMKC